MYVAPLRVSTNLNTVPVAPVAPASPSDLIQAASTSPELVSNAPLVPQTVLPITQSPVPVPTTDPGTPATSAAVPTGPVADTGVVAWAKQNPLLAAMILAGGIYAISKFLPRGSRR